MAKARTQRKSAKPIVAAAFFCEKLLEDKDGVLSAIRIVDKVTLPLGAAPDSSAPALTMPMPVLILLRSGDVIGERSLRVEGISPSGKRSEGAALEVNFLGGEKGIQIGGPVPILLEEGVQWFVIRVEGKELTRIPFEVSYARAAPETPSVKRPANQAGG